MELSGSSWRAVELTTPKVTEFDKPSGLPNEKTNSPCRSLPYFPKGRGGRPTRSTLRSARSSSRSVPMIWASTTCPLALTSDRSEEHTSELQSLRHLVCRLLLEKKKTC